MVRELKKEIKVETQGHLKKITPEESSGLYFSDEHGVHSKKDDDFVDISLVEESSLIEQPKKDNKKTSGIADHRDFFVTEMKKSDYKKLPDTADHDLSEDDQTINDLDVEDQAMGSLFERGKLMIQLEEEAQHKKDHRETLDHSQVLDHIESPPHLETLGCDGGLDHTEPSSYLGASDCDRGLDHTVSSEHTMAPSHSVFLDRNQASDHIEPPFHLGASDCDRGLDHTVSSEHTMAPSHSVFLDRNQASDRTESPSHSALLGHGQDSDHTETLEHTKLLDRREISSITDCEDDLSCEDLSVTESHRTKDDAMSTKKLKTDGVQEVKMEHLFDFSKINPADNRIKVKLEYHPTHYKKRQLEKNCTRSLITFFDHWRTHIDFRTIFATKEGKKCDKFEFFFKQRLDLFEEFFFLPKKYKLFVEKLIELLNKNIIVNEFAKNEFLQKYIVLSCILRAIVSSSEDIFKKPDSIFGILEVKNVKDQFMWKKELGSKKIAKYDLLKKQCRQILEDINAQNIKDEPEEAQEKIKKLAESVFDRNSVSDKRSFAQMMKQEMSCFKIVSKEDMQKIKNTWLRIREQIIKDIRERDVPISVSSIAICGTDVLKNVALVVDTLGSIPQEIGGVELGNWCLGKSSVDSETRRNIVFVAMLNVTNMDYVAYNDVIQQNNMKKLILFFKKLTKKEQRKIICARLSFGEKSFPLLPLLLIDPLRKEVLLYLIQKHFKSDIFNIEFRINGGREKCDIIQLLERIQDFCSRKIHEQGLSEEERIFYESFESDSGNLGPVIDQLKKIKNTEMGGGLLDEIKEVVLRGEAGQGHPEAQSFLNDLQRRAGADNIKKTSVEDSVFMQTKQEEPSLMEQQGISIYAKKEEEPPLTKEQNKSKQATVVHVDSDKSTTRGFFSKIIKRMFGRKDVKKDKIEPVQIVEKREEKKQSAIIRFFLKIIQKIFGKKDVKKDKIEPAQIAVEHAEQKQSTTNSSSREFKKEKNVKKNKIEPAQIVVEHVEQKQSTTNSSSREFKKEVFVRKNAKKDRLKSTNTPNTKINISEIRYHDSGCLDALRRAVTVIG